MKYVDKITQKEYMFVKKDEQGRYILEREMNESAKNGKIVKEEICIPEDVLNDTFEKKE